MQLMMEILVSFFVLLGSTFMLIGSIGMIRLPDLFARLHAPTKSSTLGLGSFLIAAMIYAGFHGHIGFPELIMTFLAFITGPVSANLMAQAALHLKLRSLSGEVPESIERPLPWSKYRFSTRVDPQTVADQTKSRNSEK
ncbi:Na+/H+ antiporter subunit G [Acinetobacter apis]|uniref:Multisubunit potassium/proton antiporter, PhaG subunit n=1 Tax=Acinetobacter apis TaxID=1229165 RepID=A0A217EGZ1_9GAMM|nr:Na+/H+ antiporter subunit G [Acinetobacter apis]SNQ29779.1 multisubunit potassium/proton antiporter, PhaG subunit [Acinetobacter apis]